MKADIGLIGLAVMGQNLVLNMAEKGFKVAVHNRSFDKTKEFLAGVVKREGFTDFISGFAELKQFIEAIERPRKIMLMVRAGSAVDQLIAQCLPFLQEGDIVIDGGNSHYLDSERRCKELEAKGILFVGAGVSGGEEGARHGPSIMPGGNEEAWQQIKPIFCKIAAQVDNQPCCDWVGGGGSGHYVKMVHNGIEYGDMQLICEAYHLLKEGLHFKADELAALFAAWNKEKLESYLIEITAKIFACKDRDGKPLIEKILDIAAQKGTGKWTGISALDLGIPVTLIGEAVFARCLSALKMERVEASRHYSQEHPAVSLSTDQIAEALYASKIISYAQGFMLMQAAAKEYNWELNYGNIALMWRGGCIIRSQFLGDIKIAFDADPNLKNLLLADSFRQEIKESESGLRSVVSEAALSGLPVPCISAALSFFDGYKSARLPANLLAAQRDFFGAHTYQRIDKAGTFHNDWEGSKGEKLASSYSV